MTNTEIVQYLLENNNVVNVDETLQEEVVVGTELKDGVHEPIVEMHDFKYTILLTKEDVTLKKQQLEEELAKLQ